MFNFKKKKVRQQIELDKNNIPTHIAFIMDGNGRWAKAKKLPISVGHSKGVDRVEDMIECGIELGVKNMSFYAFSTENWKRDKEEVDHLFGLIHTFYKKKFPKILKQEIALKFIGTRVGLPEDLIAVIDKMQEQSAQNKVMTVNIAFNYGGRLEIVEAANSLLKAGVLEITEENLADALYTSNQPDVDLLIRTSGEMRISNFMNWQISYAEFLFPKTLWPDFNKLEFEACLIDFQNRNRRFGGR